jgi:general secretion pathway protein G
MNIKRKGFTLIELMLVVIILGVLAAMVMPRLVGRSEQAKVAAARADISNIALALDMFEMDMGAYPASLDDLMQKGSNPDTWRGPYLKKKPLDPWGRQYEYKAGSGEGKDYDICSKGPDEAKADDDICNANEK